MGDRISLFSDSLNMNMNFVKVHTEDRKRKDKVKLFTIITVEVSPSAKFDPVSRRVILITITCQFSSHHISSHFIT